MSKTMFTPDQSRAIETRNCDLLVSAAAGSGKTAVLVERIIRIITDEQKPVDIDRLLVVTFTDAAAAEMRQRILKAVDDRLKNEPDNKHLQKQEMLMNKASITTIHSFCLGVIRKYFYLIDIDPHFRIIDGIESDLMKAEVMGELFEELYESGNEKLLLAVFGEAESNEDFLRLVDCFGDKIKDDRLQELALRVYDFIQSCPWPEKWLKESLDRLELNGIDEMESARWYSFFADDTKMTLTGVLSAIDVAMELCNHHEINPLAVQALLDDKEKISNAVNALERGFVEFYEAMDFSFTLMRLSQRKKKGEEDSEEAQALKKLISDIRAADIKKPVTDIKNKALFLNPEGILKNISDSYLNVRTLCQIVIAFSKRFYSVKRQRNVADFSDFEHLCIKALAMPESEQGNIIPTMAALELREKYEEVLTDEYQDSNLVQELILSSVSKNAGDERNRFMVGDIKQSIYKFRMANPELFRGKYNAYSTDGQGAQQRIDLSKNFRSRKSVLDAINFVFKQIMSQNLGEVTYDDSAMLHYGADYPQADEDALKTELLIMETEEDNETPEAENAGAEDAEPEENGEPSEGNGAQPDLIQELSKAELEASMVAARIKRLLGMDEGKPFQVAQKGGGFRDIERRDIVVLLRSTKNIAEAYVREFKKIELPSFSDTSTGYFEAMEIMTVLSLLKIIDNPRQDIHLISALYSMVYNISPDELILVRKCLLKGMFYDCVLEYIKNYDDGLSDKLRKFKSDLDKWRKMAVHMSISELIQQVYDDTSYFDFAGTMPSGKVRQANLRALFERAVKYEKTKLKSLFHFILYIEKMQKSKSEFGDAKVMSENDDLIRIMSIHKSKGLEFPVVFVCGLGRGFNLRDARSELLMHQDLGLGAFHVDSGVRIKYNTLARYSISKKIILESLSEEMRVLYVALTRAKEKLILTACVKGFAKKTENALRYAGGDLSVDPYYLSKKRCFLDWIICALIRHRDVMSALSLENEKRCHEVYWDESRWEVVLRNKRKTLKGADGEKKQINLLAEFNAVDPATDYSGMKTEIEKRLSFEYPNGMAVGIPSKISISEIKRIYYEMQMKESEDFIELFSLRPAFDLQKPGFIDEESGGLDSYNAARKGTLLHTVMEHLDVDEHKTLESVEKLILNLAGRGILKSEDIGHINAGYIVNFANTELADRIRKSKDVLKEIPFVLGMKPDEINKAWDKCGDETVLVHGIIDCIFEDEGEYVLLDYKSDWVSDDTAERVIHKYKTQLAVYKKAAEAALGKTLKESLIYFFHVNKWYKLE